MLLAGVAFWGGSLSVGAGVLITDGEDYSRRPVVRGGTSEEGVGDSGQGEAGGGLGRAEESGASGASGLGSPFAVFPVGRAFAGSDGRGRLALGEIMRFRPGLPGPAGAVTFQDLVDGKVWSDIRPELR